MAAQRIGVIGLGAMGGGMAASLVRAGHRVSGYDPAAAAGGRLAAAGGAAGTSPAEAAREAAVLAVVTATDAQAEQALFGEDGAVAALPPGAVVALHATVPPDAARRLAQRLADAGIAMLDAPISGGKARADDGSLTVMASGSEAAFAGCEEHLAAIAGKVYRLGAEPGQGSTVKMVHQLLAGVHIAAAGEAMALAARAGIDPAQFFEVATNGAADSWMLRNRGPRMLSGDPTPFSAVEIFVKDLGIVLQAGRDLRFPLPIAAAAHQQFLGAAAAGHGREDDSRVVSVYETLAGISVATAKGDGE